MRNPPEALSRDTPAWRFLVWASFVLAIGGTTIAVLYLPLEPWLRAFLGLAYAYSISSTFTLAKTIRDEFEADKLMTRLDEAKAERLLRGQVKPDAGEAAWPREAGAAASR